MIPHSRFRESCLVATSLAVVLYCGCAFRGGGSGVSFNSYMNQTPPELTTGGDWINSADPLSLAALHGRVVWLEFSFLN